MGLRGRRIRKPSPVTRARRRARVAIIHLARESPRASSDATRRLGRTALKRLPISSCSEWGLPCDRRYRRPGELLPHHFTLTARPTRGERSGGIFSAALSLGSPPPAVDWHSVLWSSDFPPAQRAGDRLDRSDAGCIDMNAAARKQAVTECRSTALKTRSIESYPTLSAWGGEASSCSALRPRSRAGARRHPCPAGATGLASRAGARARA